MRTRPVLLNNRFKASQEPGFDSETESIVFISYKRSPDLPIALECAERLDGVDGVTYWIDEEDECIADAHSKRSDIHIAECIEKGLDVSSALLSIIGPETWDSPWVPYEIGGARGRQRFSITYTYPRPHPLIAHLIHGNIEDAPDFIALGTPLVDLYEVARWARSVAKILKEVQESSNRKVLYGDREEIRSSYGVNEIYKKNTQHLSLY